MAGAEEAPMRNGARLFSSGCGNDVLGAPFPSYLEVSEALGKYIYGGVRFRGKNAPEAYRAGNGRNQYFDRFIRFSE